MELLSLPSDFDQIIDNNRKTIWKVAREDRPYGYSCFEPIQGLVREQIRISLRNGFGIKCA